MNQYNKNWFQVRSSGTNRSVEFYVHLFPPLATTIPLSKTVIKANFFPWSRTPTGTAVLAGALPLGGSLLSWQGLPVAGAESTGAAHDEKVFQLAPRLYLRNYLRNLQSIPRTLQGDEFAMCVTMCGGYLYCRWGVDLLWWMDFTEESPGFPDFTEKFSVFSQINLRNYLRNLQSIPRTLW